MSKAARCFLVAAAVAVVAPLLLALTWTTPSPPDGDQRVRYSRAVAGYLVIECYAFEPYEDRMYFDLTAVGLLGASVKLVNMRGTYTTPDACKYAAHMEATRLTKVTSDALLPAPKCPVGQRC